MTEDKQKKYTKKSNECCRVFLTIFTRFSNRSIFIVFHFFLFIVFFPFICFLHNIVTVLILKIFRLYSFVLRSFSFFIYRLLHVHSSFLCLQYVASFFGLNFFNLSHAIFLPFSCDILLRHFSFHAILLLLLYAICILFLSSSFLYASPPPPFQFSSPF